MSSSERPLAIAHRAANRLSRLREAFAAGVDYAEADLWLYKGRLEVRHEKTLRLLPFLWDRWLLKPAWTPRLSFADLLAAAGRGKLFVDLKAGDAPTFGDEVAAAVERAGASDTVAFCGAWSALDRLAELLPGAPLYYTIGRLERLEELRPRWERREIPAVSIDSRILTAEIIPELRASGVGPVVTWAVEDAGTARQVLAWGASGIISDSLELLIAVRNGEFDASA